MKPFMQLVTFSSGLFLCSLAAAQSNMESSSMSKSEAMQLSQDMSPKARGQLAKREAYAAYNEAVSACKGMERSGRKDCMSEAKSNLRSDLNYAKEIRTSGTSMGASGTGSDFSSSSGSSAARVSGANDLSSAGGGAGGMSGTDASGNGHAAGMHHGARNLGAQSAGDEKLSAAEKKQFVQSFTPQAQYKLATREAHAAYNEALKACKSMPKADRTSCTNEARANLKSDMAYAKSQYQQDKSESSGGSAAGQSSGMQDANR